MSVPISRRGFAAKVLTLSAAFAAPLARAEENKFDVVARTLLPFLNIFAKQTSSPNRAFSLKLRLEQMTDLPPELVGTSVDVDVQYPDKLRLHGPILGEQLTVCRVGQGVWAYPGSRIAPLLELAREKKKLPKLDPDAELGDFSLPIPEKQLAFLPALFQVTDVGSEALDGVPCRVLDLQLMPLLAKSLKVEGWIARAWVRPDHTPARLSIARTGWSVALRFDSVVFAPSLTSDTWRPTPEQAGDILKVTPPLYHQLLGLIIGSSGKKKRD